MSPKQIENPLARLLQYYREQSRISLRGVEARTRKENLRIVSNSYLSQMERGLISKPCPDVLQSLAIVYKVPYDELLCAAGYTLNKPEIPARRIVDITDFTGDDLDLIEEFVELIRKRRKKVTGGISSG